LSTDDLADIYQLRGILEPAAVKLAVPQMDSQQVERLAVLHEEAVKTVRSGAVAAQSSINRRWHWAIYDDCGSR
jgi:DNA-binding GntR family transcriptional regulator